MEHKIIGGIGMGIVFIISVLVGVFLGRRVLQYLPPVPAKKRVLLLAISGPLFLVLSVGQYYLGNFLSDGKTSVESLLVGDAPVWAMFLSACFSSYIARKRNGIR